VIAAHYEQTLNNLGQRDSLREPAGMGGDHTRGESWMRGRVCERKPESHLPFVFLVIGQNLHGKKREWGGIWRRIRSVWDLDDNRWTG